MPARRKSAITASGSIVTRGGRRNTSRSYFAFADSEILDYARLTRLLEGTRQYYDLRGGGGGGGGGVGVGVGVDGGGGGSWLTDGADDADRRGVSNKINAPFLRRRSPMMENVVPRRYNAADSPKTRGKNA